MAKHKKGKTLDGNEVLRKQYAEDWQRRQDIFITAVRKLCQEHGIVMQIDKMSMIPAELAGIRPTPVMPATPEPAVPVSEA